MRLWNLKTWGWCEVLKVIVKALYSFIAKPEFRRLATSIDYLQLVSYDDKDDLMIVLGHNPTQEQPQQEQPEQKPKLSLQFLLSVHKMAPEGIIQPFDRGTSLTFLIDKTAKEKVKEALK